MKNEEEKLTILLKAISDVNRRRLLELMHNGKQVSLFEICSVMLMNHQVSITRQAMSKHLKILIDAGLLDVEWRGNTKLHKIKETAFDPVLTGWLAQFKEKK